MRINMTIVQVVGGTVVPIFLAFLGEAIVQMVPWLIVMFTIVISDLAAGIWKCYKLDVPVRFSRACRETMGKLIVYFAFVIMICCINVAMHDTFNWAKWSALLVVVIEGGSIIGNILKPHGIDISLGAIVKAFLNHSMLPLTCPEVDEIVKKKPLEEIREEELKK